MKAIADPSGLLASGLAAIRAQFSVPVEFPEEVLAEAESAATRPLTDHADWTDRAFVTLDPATSTDLDQAFLIEPDGDDLILHYALSDIGWFVPRGGAMEAEAWRRGVTLYLPDGRARLYPAVLSEGVASLLPDGPRPSIVAIVRCDRTGNVKLETMVRAVIRSTAKLAYENTAPEDLPYLAEFAARIERGKAERGAASVDTPDQGLEKNDAGGFSLELRAWLPSEVANSALSLAANVAIAQALLEAGTGVFREMPPPSDRAIAQLRNTASALGLIWPENATFTQFNRSVDPATKAGATFQLAVRRASGSASYVPYKPGRVPWHAALGATYTHATAPMRRLADRYILEAALDLARETPPTQDRDFLARVADAMNTADSREGAIERAVLNLAEAVMLSGREGEVFDAAVIDLDDRGARIQLADLPVLARVDTDQIAAGEPVRVRLMDADPQRGFLHFERVT